MKVPFVSLLKQSFHVFVGTVPGRYLFVIRHIVSGVGKGRIKAGIQPKGVAPQIPDIIQAADDSLQVADPVGVRVLKACLLYTSRCV